MDEIIRALDLIGITIPDGLLDGFLMDVRVILRDVPAEYMAGGGVALVVLLWWLFRKKRPLKPTIAPSPPAPSPVSDPQPEQVDVDPSPAVAPLSGQAFDAVDARLATLESRGGDLAASLVGIRQTLEAGDRDSALTALRELGDSEHRAARELRDRAQTQMIGATTIKLATGDLSMSAQDFETAAQQFAQAIETLPNGQDSLLAECLNKHGLAAYHVGKLDDAALSFKRASRVLERIRGLDHPDVATALNNLAMVHQGRGDLAAAESLYQRALRIDEGVLSEDANGRSLDVAADLNNLALLYMNQQLYGDAAPLLQRSLEIKEALLDDDHPSLETGRRNHAELQRALAQAEGAEASQ